MRKKITTQKKEAYREHTKELLDKRFSDSLESKYTIDEAYTLFYLWQSSKNNSKATIDFYARFYNKLCECIVEYFKSNVKEAPIELLCRDGFQIIFMDFLKKSIANNTKKEPSVQTINAYLRGLRSFGNYCDKNGFIDGFSCPIKEVEPPVKEVYTDAELKKLLVKPPIEYFEEFRTYTIINLMLSTGARCNTILNIKLEDVNIDDGYIIFNTTKTNKTVRMGLQKRAISALIEYIDYWKNDENIDSSEYLFTNVYGDKLTRNGLYTSVKRYNLRRGVNKTGLHLFRHTFAKTWITSGGDIITLAKVLTHSELDMVKRYSNLYGSDIKAEIEEHSILANLRINSGDTLKTQKRKQIKKEQE